MNVQTVPEAGSEPSDDVASDAEVDVRQTAIGIIRSQPADASFDEILRALAFHRVVERGLADAEAGRLMSHETFRRKLKSWLG